MAEEKTYLLKLSERGLEIIRPNEIDAKEKPVKPIIEDIKEPRWQHWSQRKLARVWHATMLGMNIEPTPKARAALKELEPSKYEIYKDRLDIAKALLGYDLEYYEDHGLEGDGVGDKYISLAEYYEFAAKKGWAGLDAMRVGLQMDKNPPVLSKRKENNYLELLHEIFDIHVADYMDPRPAESASAVMAWLKKINAHCPVTHQTLCDWVQEMKSVKEERTEKRKRKQSTE